MKAVHSPTQAGHVPRFDPGRSGYINPRSHPARNCSAGIAKTSSPRQGTRKLAPLDSSIRAKGHALWSLAAGPSRALATPCNGDF
jgi:hypothetical protein